MTVSVVIPCYNLGRYVEEAVDSVLGQTYQDFEVLVVNDGSTDPLTNAVLDTLRRPRTTVLTTEHRGLPAARNHAIEHARGRYVSALDADDTLHPEFLEKTIAVLERDPSVAFVSTWLECFGTEQWIWRQDRCDFPALLAECVVLTASPVRREALDAVGGYDVERFSEGDEDWDLWISLVEKGYRGAIIPDVLFSYRQREGSMRRVCTRGAVRTRLWQNLLTKHRDSYLRFLPEVLLLQEDECGRLLRENSLLERELHGRLDPLIAERLAERDRLRAELTRPLDPAARIPCAPREQPAGAHARIHELETALDAARAEIGALRASWSWAITAPLRRAYDGWLAVRRHLATASRGGR